MDVFIRLLDSQTKTFYEGWVMAFSEDEEHRELYLEDAKFFNADGKCEYSCASLYLSRTKDEITLIYPHEMESDHGTKEN